VGDILPLSKALGLEDGPIKGYVLIAGTKPAISS